jgi:hypothetical protein
LLTNNELCQWTMDLANIQQTPSGIGKVLYGLVRCGTGHQQPVDIDKRCPVPTEVVEYQQWMVYSVTVCWTLVESDRTPPDLDGVIKAKHITEFSTAMHHVHFSATWTGGISTSAPAGIASHTQHCHLESCRLLNT